LADYASTNNYSNDDGGDVNDDDAPTVSLLMTSHLHY
jgi:hypothetical protein